MPCVVFYLILMHLNSGFLDKDSVVSELIDFNQKLVFPKLRFWMGSEGNVAYSSGMLKSYEVFLNSEFVAFD